MSIDTAFPAIKIPAKLISPGCYYFFFLSRGWNSSSSSTAWFLLNVWSEIILNKSYISELKKKDKPDERYKSTWWKCTYIHTHKTHMPSFFKVTSRVTFIFCTCVEFMTINIVFEERRQCKAPAFYKNHQRLESVPIDMHAIPTTVKIFFRYF